MILFNRSCTTLDHVYPVHATASSILPGTSCYCGMRRWPDMGRSGPPLVDRVVEPVAARPQNAPGAVETPSTAITPSQALKLAHAPAQAVPAGPAARPAGGGAAAVYTPPSDKADKEKP